MKIQSSALIWALGVLALAMVGVSSFYAWKAAPGIPAPIFVSLGDLDAYAGGKRLVKATVVLELGSKTIQSKITQGMTRAKASVIKSFNSISERRILTTEGKHELQQLIREDLNEHFGPSAVREVLFTNLVVSIS